MNETVYIQLMSETRGLQKAWFLFDINVTMIGAILSIYIYGKMNASLKKNELPFVRKHLKILFMVFFSKVIVNEVRLTF